MKSLFSNKKMTALLLVLLFAVFSIFISSALAKYTTVKDVGSFNLHIRGNGGAYAVYTTDHSLEFYFGSSYPEVGEQLENGKTVSAVYYNDIESESYVPEWSGIAAEVQSVIFVNSVAPANTSSWFSGFSNATIFDLANLDTSNVTNMSHMFDGCKRVTTLDLSGFDTAKVKNMSYMFQSCYALETLDISHFNTENVTTMQKMFQSCKVLENLDVSMFNTENVTNMMNMFNTCERLVSLSLTNFNTAKVTTMERMFAYSINLSSLDLSSFNTGEVKNMTAMFDGCTGLTSLDISGFNTSKVTTMYYLFHSCKKLKTIIASQNFIVKSNTITTNMFSGCESLVGGNDTPFTSDSSTYACIDKAGQAGYFTCGHISISNATDNQDGTHGGTCDYCEKEVASKAHLYINGQCVCGKAEEPESPTQP